MLCLELRKNGVEIARELDIDLLLLDRRKLIPARLAPVAVVIPLEKRNVVLGEELVEEAVDIGVHIGPGKVEHELIALLGTRTAGEIQHPVRMLSIEIGVG